MASDIEMQVMSKRAYVCMCTYIYMFFIVSQHMTSVSLFFEKCENNWFGINKVSDILKGQC